MLSSILSLLNLTAIAQEFDWVRQFGNIYQNHSSGKMGIDSMGNAYCTYSTLPNNAKSRLVKHDFNGNPIWQSLLYSTTNYVTQYTHITVGKYGNIYLAGNFNDSLIYAQNLGGTWGIADSNNIINSSISSFVMKLDSNGVLIWIKQFVGPQYYITSLTINKQEDIILSGNFQDSIDTNLDSGKNILFSTSIADNSFVAKYDSNGNQIWARQYSCTFSNPKLIARNNSIYFCSSFNGSIDTLAGPAVSLINSLFAEHVVLTKLNAQGEMLWTRIFEGSSDNFLSDFKLRPDGKLFTLGTFADTSDLDPTSTINQMIAKGYSDIYLSMYDTVGNYYWSQQFGGFNWWEKPIGIALSPNKDIYMSANYRDTFYYSTPNGIDSIISKNDFDFLLARLDNNGHVIHMSNMGGFGDEFLSDIQTDYQNNLKLLGHHRGTTDFDPGLSTLDSTSNDSITIFLLKLNHCDLDTTITINGITLTSNAGNCKYQWYNCATNQILVNDTLQQFTATQNGNYAVVITSGGCSDTSACYTISTVNINQFNDNKNFEIYPNPTANYFIIKSILPIKQTKITISTYTGQKVLVKNYNTFTQDSFELKGTKGIYFIEIKSLKNKYFYKLTLD